MLEQNVLRTVDISVLEQLFDRASDVAFFIKDKAGRYVTVNQSLVQRHGLESKSEVIGLLPSDICVGDLGRIPTEQDASVVGTGQPLVDQLELQWHRPNEPVWCLTTKLPIRNSEGIITGIVGFSRDIRVSVSPDEIPVAFAEAVKEFEDQLADAVTPAWLAERSSMSPHQLARMTKRLFGLTPGQFITKTRITAATRMLQESSDSVAAIAQRCGFYDHSAFTRAFRSATGLTPTSFRRQ